MGWTEPKYPTDVPNFTPEDKHGDPVALLEYREAVARRKQIDVEKARVRIAFCAVHNCGKCLQRQQGQDMHP